MSTNKEVVNKAIAFENNTYPFRFSQTGVLTGSDRALFPYRNWYRGQYMSPFPIIADREAGFYPRIYPYPSYDYYANPFGGYYNYNSYAYYPQHRFWGPAKQPRFIDNYFRPGVNVSRSVRADTQSELVNELSQPNDSSGRLVLRRDPPPLFLYR